MRTSFGARVVLVALALLALLAASGCAASNRDTFVRERAGEHVYNRPMAEVWAAAKQLLTDDGYTGRESKGQWVYVTEWKDADGQASVGSRFTRYLVEGKELGPNKSVVRFTQVLRATGSTGAGVGDTERSTHSGMASMRGSGEAGADATGGVPQSGQEGIGPRSALATGKRDLTMEWRLLQKLEPTTAGAIESEALRKHPD